MDKLRLDAGARQERRASTSAFPATCSRRNADSHLELRVVRGGGEGDGRPRGRELTAQLAALGAAGSQYRELEVCGGQYRGLSARVRSKQGGDEHDVRRSRGCSAELA